MCINWVTPAISLQKRNGEVPIIANFTPDEFRSKDFSPYPIAFTKNFCSILHKAAKTCDIRVLTRKNWTMTRHDTPVEPLAGLVPVAASFNLLLPPTGWETQTDFLDFVIAGRLQRYFPWENRIISMSSERACEHRRTVTPTSTTLERLARG